MDFLAMLIGVASVMIGLIYLGVKVMGRDEEYYLKQIKKEWCTRASKHLQSYGNTSKLFADDYAETLYVEYSYTVSSVDNWMDNPEAVVEEDVSYWEK